MFFYREDRITHELKKFDTKLYCSKNYKGIYQVLREHYQLKPMYVDGVGVINFMEKCPHHVFSLTDTTNDFGVPTEWGLERIMAKVRECDLQVDDCYVDEVIEQQHKVRESKERDLKSRSEDLAKELRPAFAKTFNDINTANLAKVDSRRRKDGISK